jgi:hypothetical protein
VSGEGSKQTNGSFLHVGNGGNQQHLQTSDQFSIEVLDLMFKIVTDQIRKYNHALLLILFDFFLH